MVQQLPAPMTKEKNTSITDIFGNTAYYVNDTSGSLTMVVAETDEADKEKAYYTRGLELISMEKEGEIWYYLYDGHGNVRNLTNEEGRVTDRYTYEAYGTLIENKGDTENEFLYTGEQYNTFSGFYYLRARYMNPGTGTFISKDSYQGNIHDPVTLHKYLYANANPVMYTDPSGCESVASAAVYMEYTTSATIIENYYNAMIFCAGMQLIAQLRAVNSVNAIATMSSDTIMQIGVDEAYAGTSNTKEISSQLLMDSINTVTLAYLIANDCIALDVVSITIEEAKEYIESTVISLKQIDRKNIMDFVYICYVIV